MQREARLSRLRQLVVKVNDLDEKLAELKAAGVEIIMSKFAVGPTGFYAKIKDSEGNELGVWQDA